MWNIERVWGLYVVMLGAFALSGAVFTDSTPRMGVFVVLGLGLVYHGVAMVRSGSHTP